MVINFANFATKELRKLSTIQHICWMYSYGTRSHLPNHLYYSLHFLTSRARHTRLHVTQCPAVHCPPPAKPRTAHHQKTVLEYTQRNKRVNIFPKCRQLMLGLVDIDSITKIRPPVTFRSLISVFSVRLMAS